MTKHTRRGMAAALLTVSLLVGPGAAHALADDDAVDAVAGAFGVPADELLDAVPYPAGVDRDEVKAARKAKAARDRAVAVDAEFEDETDEETDDDDGTATKPSLGDGIAVAFSVEPADVVALREDGVGWGAIFKLHQIAHARNVPVAELLADTPRTDDGYEFDFGALRKSLTEDERARMDDKPRNVGAIRGNRPAHAGPTSKAEKDAAKAERKAAKDERQAADEGEDDDAGDDEDDGGDHADDAERPERDKPGKWDKRGKRGDDEAAADGDTDDDDD